MKHKTKYSVLRYGDEIFTSDNDLIANAYAHNNRTIWGDKAITVVKHNKKEWN